MHSHHAAISIDNATISSCRHTEKKTRQSGRERRKFLRSKGNLHIWYPQDFETWIPFSSVWRLKIEKYVGFFNAFGGIHKVCTQKLGVLCPPPLLYEMTDDYQCHATFFIWSAFPLLPPMHTCFRGAPFPCGRHTWKAQKHPMMQRLYSPRIVYVVTNKSHSESPHISHRA